ncbi:hypothetical protein [Lysinibacillus sp. SGAir0095]|uniref:hypothetical protein n=1 Tax=Lysinibacillus sp. SGAir0095 TaxID=2070463 RepID=UPI0010CD2FAE|nr:hypothetical protein [Lysinibacillus sp. SGAir0095]QCR31032.1 hypothetical protein C1N55_02125 [Lysinibacillus sp. SGAir0095]
MKFNNSFPYPVLSSENDNYKNSKFETSIEAQKSFGQLYINLKCNLQDSVISRLIGEEKAKYALHIECPQTSFRQIFQSDDPFIVATIPDNRLRGKVDVHPFILANKRIEDYDNPSLNDFYKGFPITFEKGNLLALGEAVEITLFEEDEESQNLPSIVTIRRSESAKDMVVSLNSPQIIIELPKHVYDNYAQNAGSRLKETILSLVILPSLIDVFYSLKEDSADYSEYKWYQVLEQIFKKNNVPFSHIVDGTLPVLKAAQMVLQNPLEKAFEEIHKLNEAEAE